MEISDKKLSIVNSSIFLIVFTSWVYFSAYKYEQGYCSHFNIPSYLIEVSVNNLLTFAAAAVTFFIFISFSSGLFIPLLEKAKKHPKPHLRKVLGLNAFLAILLWMLPIAFPFQLNVYLTFLAIVLTLNLLLWGIPTLLSIFGKNPFQRGIELGDELGKEVNLWPYIKKYFGASSIDILFVIIMVPIFAFFLGLGEAMRQQSFYIFDGKPNTIVLRKYGDCLICSRINVKKLEVSDTVFVYKLNDKDAVQLTQHVFGELRQK